MVIYIFELPESFFLLKFSTYFVRNVYDINYFVNTSQAYKQFPRQDSLTSFRPVGCAPAFQVQAI